MTPRPPAGDASAPRALFVHRGGFSGTNVGLLAALRRQKGDVVFDELDITTLSSGKEARLLIAALREYGASTLFSRALLKRRLHRNRSYFEVVGERFRRWLGDRRYAFSLQTQSLFDVSTGRFPNLVYTDHVALASGGAGAEAHSAAWLECEAQIYRNAAHVFTFGSSIRRMLLESYGLAQDKVTRIGSGANVTPDRPVNTDLARYARRNVLFVGIEWERKGGPDLLAAFRLLRARLPDATLTIVGCSPPEAIGVEGCDVVGRLPFAAVGDRFREASCFCLPSRLEPYGIVIAEAGHFALPVVATDIGDIGDMVRNGGNGWRVAPGQPEALCEAMARVLAEPRTAQEMGGVGAEMARDWTWDAVAAGILARSPLRNA